MVPASQDAIPPLDLRTLGESLVLGVAKSTDDHHLRNIKLSTIKSILWAQRAHARCQLEYEQTVHALSTSEHFLKLPQSPSSATIPVLNLCTASVRFLRYLP